MEEIGGKVNFRAVVEKAHGSRSSGEAARFAKPSERRTSLCCRPTARIPYPPELQLRTSPSLFFSREIECRNQTLSERSWFRFISAVVSAGEPLNDSNKVRWSERIFDDTRAFLCYPERHWINYEVVSKFLQISVNHYNGECYEISNLFSSQIRT